MAGIRNRKKEDRGCRKCSTWAEITEYYCGCVTVEIFDNRNPCDVVASAQYLSDYTEDLQIEAEQLMAGESSVTYSFSLHIRDAELLSGRATVVLDADEANI